MFTRTVDDAVARYETDEGVKIAFAYDHDAPNPVEEYGYSIGIKRLEWDYIATDPHGLLEDWHRTEEAIAEADAMAWAMGMTLDEALAELDDNEDLDPVYAVILHECREAMQERKDLVRIEWTDYAEYWHPTYEVVYSLKGLSDEGWNRHRADEIVKSLAREYSAWANGSVYLMGVETPQGEEEYHSCWPGVDPSDPDEVAEEIEAHGYSSKGLRES